MSDLPVLDIEQIHRFVGDDAALKSEIFGLFQNQLDTWLKVFSADADPSAWTSAAHALKGSAKGVGAMKLGEICARAETLGKDGASRVAFSVLTQEIREAAEEVREAISHHDRRAAVRALRNAV